VLIRSDNSATESKRRGAWQFAAGALCGLLFLCDYSAVVAILVVLVFAAMRFKQSRPWILALSALGFLGVAAPWVVTTTQVSGRPLGLAWHGIGLKAGDPTAEPATFRATFAAIAPQIDVFKLGNKILTRVQEAMHEELWSGGGFILAAFFVAGLVYRFRSDNVAYLRWYFVALLVALVVSQACFDSGEGERHPMTYAAPLIMIFGAGFFSVLIASSQTWADHSRGALLLLLALQAAPLTRDLLEPARLPFNYPPYYPPLFVGMRQEMTLRGGSQPVWMADVPAGAAWYSGQSVWAQPAALRDFYRIGAEQPMLALMLTPKTLDAAFLSAMTRPTETSDRLGEWPQVYRGLITGRFPSAFPLTTAQKISDSFFVLLDPSATARPGK
jgi:hypothetical protein